jgi:hypothetical protein
VDEKEKRQHRAAVRSAIGRIAVSTRHGNKDDERRARRDLELLRAKEYADKAKALRASARSR